jgi:hypothetical protein
MTYPLAHKIDTRHPYVRAVDTDIRATFAKFQNAKTQSKPVLRTVSVSTAARDRQEQSGGFPVLLEKF